MVLQIQRQRGDVGFRGAVVLAVNDGTEVRIQPRKRAIGGDQVPREAVDVGLGIEMRAVGTQVVRLHDEVADGDPNAGAFVLAPPLVA